MTRVDQRVNSDLVGKVVNIASRCSGFITKHFNNTLSDRCAELDLLQSFIDANVKIAELYEAREFGKAMREIMALADRANQYIDEKKPWAIAKIDGANKELHEVCSIGLNLFRIIVTYLKPVSGCNTHKSSPPGPAANTMPSDTPNRIFRGFRLAAGSGETR